jgi:hypothetical protein
MRCWYFSETACHPAWEEGLKRGSLRVVLRNRNLDPQIAHGLLTNSTLFAREVLPRLRELNPQPKTAAAE